MDKFLKIKTASGSSHSSTDNNNPANAFKDVMLNLGPDFDSEIDFPGLEEGYNAGANAVLRDFSLADVEELLDGSPPTTQKTWERITKNESSQKSSQPNTDGKQEVSLSAASAPSLHVTPQKDKHQEEPTGTPVCRAPSQQSDDDKHSLEEERYEGDAFGYPADLSALLDDEEEYVESADNIETFAKLVTNNLAYAKPGNSCEFERYWDVYNEERLKCRPKGAVDFYNPFKNGKAPCSCGCSSRNKKNTAPSEVYKDGVLNGFRRTGWLTPEHPYVALLVPNSTPVLGRLLFDVYDDDERYDTITLQDLITGYLYCCPLAWLFSVCMHLFSNRLVSNPEEMMENIAGHMRSSTMGYRFLYVLDLKCHLHQLSFAYRHFVNMHSMKRTIVNRKCVAIRPHIDSVEFPDRTEIAKLFENNDNVIRNEDEIWNYALRRRLVHVKETLVMYQKYFLLNSRVLMPSSVCGAILKMSLRHLFFVDAIVDDLASACIEDNQATPLMITNGIDDVNINDDNDDNDVDDNHDAIGQTPDDIVSANPNDNSPRMPNTDREEHDDIEDSAYPEDRPYPPCDVDLLVCPCKCDFTGPPNPDTFEELSAMAMMGWIQFGMQVFLRMPHMDPVPGLLYLWKRNPHDPNIPCPEFLDLETGRRYCCARAWIYGTYMYLYSEGRITSSPVTVCEVRKALRSKFYASECVYIPEYRTPLSHLLNCYRMGIQARLHGNQENRQIALHNPHASGTYGQRARASFLTRDEMLLVNDNIPEMVWPEGNPYMLRLRDQVTAVENKIEHCREAVATISAKTLPATIAQKLVALPLHEWRTIADLLHVVDEKVHSDFYTHQT